MKKSAKIGLAIGVGVLGYLLVTNWSKIVSKFKGGASDDGADTSAASTEPGSDGGPSEYETLVEKLQSALGVAIDGIPGKQTNGKLEEYYSVSEEAFNAEKAFASGYPNLKKWGKGVVSPENVKWYIWHLANKTTPKQLTPLRRRLEAIKANVAAGKVGFFIQDIQLPLAYADSISQAMKLTGGYATIKAGQKFNYIAASSWENVTLYVRVVVNNVPRVVKVEKYQLENIGF